PPEPIAVERVSVTTPAPALHVQTPSSAPLPVSPQQVQAASSPSPGSAAQPSIPSAPAPPPSNPMTSTVQNQPPETEAPGLLDNPGEAVAPSNAANRAAPPAYQTGSYSSSPELQIKSPVTYSPTRFEEKWAPRDESALGQAVRETTVDKRVIPLP